MALLFRLDVNRHTIAAWIKSEGDAVNGFDWSTANVQQRIKPQQDISAIKSGMIVQTMRYFLPFKWRILKVFIRC